MEGLGLQLGALVGVGLGGLGFTLLVSRKLVAVNSPDGAGATAPAPADVALKFKSPDSEAAAALVAELRQVGFLHVASRQDGAWRAFAVTSAKLLETAQILQFRKPLLDGGALVRVRSDMLHLFVPVVGGSGTSPEQLFTPAERIQIGEHLLRMRGDGIEENLLLSARKAGVLEDSMLLHHWGALAEVSNGGASSDKLRPYFGEGLAYYFEFLGLYAKALVLPGILGLATHAYQIHAGSVDNMPSILFSLFMALWASVFLIAWRRRQAHLAHGWGLFGENAVDLERPEFRGQWRVNPITGTRQKVAPFVQQQVKQVLSFFAALLATLLTLAMYAGLCEVNDLVCAWSARWDPANGLARIVIDLLPTVAMVAGLGQADKAYRSLAHTLTDWENRRTENSYRNSLLGKLILFQAVNNFGWLFWVAFVQQDLAALRSCLVTLMVIRQVVDNLVEVGLPFFNTRKSSGARTLAAESDRAVCGGSFDDFLELFVQFGNITLFTAAFPLAPLWALVNNVVEGPSDLFKIAGCSRRPRPERASGIDPSWMAAFDLIGYLAVVTNVALIGLMSIADERAALGNKSGDLLSNFAPHFFMLVALEHVLIALKALVNWAVPDAPAAVLEAIKLDERAGRALALRELERKALKKD
jgi:hypothetical protein